MPRKDSAIETRPVRDTNLRKTVTSTHARLKLHDVFRLFVPEELAAAPFC